MDRKGHSMRYVAAAMIAAVGALVNVALQLSNPQFDAVFTTAADWGNEISFMLLVSASMVAMWGMIASEIAPRRAGLTFIAGQGLLFTGLAVGVVLGHAPEWFFVLGGPGNLIALGGLVAVAVYAVRRRTLPPVVAVLLPLSIVLGVGAAEFGGGIVAFVAWVAIAWRFTSATSRPVPAAA